MYDRDYGKCRVQLMLILYTQPRCHFCEILKRMLSKMDGAEDCKFVDITKDPEAKAFLKKKGHKTVPMLYWRVPGHDIWINKDIDTKKLTGENLGQRIKDAVAATKKNNCLVFDVDGTITPSRDKIDPAYAEVLLELSKKVDIYFLTGSDFAKTKEQLGDLTKVVKGSYQCAGNELWVNDELVQSVPEFTMSNSAMLKWCKQRLAESPFPVRTGKKHIDLRPGMMNFSIIGRGCTKKQRQQYIKYDEKTNEREQLARDFNEVFRSYSAQIAGETGIDVCEEGRDKGQVYKPLQEVYNSIIFFGDDTQEGGNDFPFAKQIQSFPHRCFHVSGPEETFELLEGIKRLFVDVVDEWPGIDSGVEGQL
jgi:phosphomannomutase